MLPLDRSAGQRSTGLLSVNLHNSRTLLRKGVAEAKSGVAIDTRVL